MEHAQRIDLVLARLKNALAESEALKKDILERKGAKELPDTEAESEGSDAGGSEAEASETEASETEASDEPEEKPVKKTWCCCFRKQKLN
jgi:hypothetical protein